MSREYYTDGSAKANGRENSSGGYGVVCIDNNKIIWQFQDNKSPTTNNEMELMGILCALGHISESEKTFVKPIIYTDSAYCYNLINTWMYNWERNDWTRPKGQSVKNLEIIQQIFELADLADIKLVKGHSGVTWNEYADKLATYQIRVSENVK